MGTIITRKQGNNTYYLYQETYRAGNISGKNQQKGFWEDSRVREK
jgi:hypothetical protein